MNAAFWLWQSVGLFPPQSTSELTELILVDCQIFFVGWLNIVTPNTRFGFIGLRYRHANLVKNRGLERFVS
jgi:hypothetical protein